MLLSEQLKSLCAEHDLNSISVGMHVFSHDEAQSFTAYAHWRESGGKCASASDCTPEMAIAKAVAEANAIRGRGVVAVSGLEMAA